MPSSEHDIMLRMAIKKLKASGFRVIRLDRRNIPDAIAINSSKIYAVEVYTRCANVHLAKRILKDSQYDEEIIVTKKYDEHYHKPEVYYKVLALRKKNESYRAIRRKVMREFNLNHLSISTIVDWVKGKKKPLTLLANL